MSTPPFGAESGEGREFAENRRGGEAQEDGQGFGAPANDAPTHAIKMRLPCTNAPKPFVRGTVIAYNEIAIVVFVRRGEIVRSDDFSGERVLGSNAVEDGNNESDTRTDGTD